MGGWRGGWGHWGLGDGGRGRAGLTSGFSGGGGVGLGRADLMSGVQVFNVRFQGLTSGFGV